MLLPALLIALTPAPYQNVLQDAAARGVEPRTAGQTEASSITASDLRLNVFTESSQDNVSVVQLADSHLVAVWHSRRQEEGTYGIRARRLTAGGEPVGDEIAINATLEGMQVEPSLSAEPGATGGVWFAWVSRGQDGSGDGVWARRFAPALDRASKEIQVSDRTEGDQSEPAIIALENGGAICVWTGPGAPAEGESATARRAVFARLFDDAGRPAGPKLQLAGDPQSTYRTPAAVRYGGGVLVAMAESDAAGRPSGIVLRQISAKGELGDPVRVDESEGLPVEPALAATGERVAVAWLVANPQSGGEYEIRWRNARASLDGHGAWTLGALNAVEAPLEGYTSGLSIAAQDDATALTWARYENGDSPRLYGTIYTESISTEPTSDGAAKGGSKLLIRPIEMAAAHGGNQAMSVGGTSPRVTFLMDGRLAAAWHGDGDLGDKSGAHLSLVTVDTGSPTPRVFAECVIDPEATESLPALAGPALSGAAEPALATEPAGLLRSGSAAPTPHDPPTFNPKDIDDSFETQRSMGPGGDIDFRAFSSTGWNPPDPEMAVGMNHIVAIVNGGIRFFDKQGNQQFTDSINGTGGFWGAQGATSFVFDPEVLWDPHTDRFVAIAAERDGSRSYYLLAISDDGDPNGNWFKYRFDVTPIIGNNIDSVNLSVDDSAVYLTADFFSPTRYFIYIVDKSSVLNGGAAITTNTTITGRHSMGAPVNYDSGAGAGYFIFAPEGTAPNSIAVYAVTDPLGTPQVQFTDVPVPTYTRPGDPPQMGTSNRPELFEARFWNAVLRNGKLWATHHQGTPAKQRWYEIDLAGWPQSGQSPSLVQSGEIDPGPGIATFFGSLWVDESGDMALTCAQSSNTSFISMVRTSRAASDPPGFTEPLETVITSTSPETSGRWGDYSATNDDPARTGRFWGHHEYRTSSWQTRIAGFDTCVGGIESYCVSSPNSVGAGATLSASGSVSITANSLQIVSVGTAPDVFGVFFYGDDRASVLTGDGVRCVSGNLYRVAITQADFIGRSFLDLDVTLPPVPAALITAGSTWNFQQFYRDVQPGGSGLNFTDALAIQFCQ